MDKIKYSQVTESGQFQFVAEASTLGLAPGEWPPRLPTEIGNGQDFVRRTVRQRDGEIESVTYAQLLGCVDLVVLND